MYMRLYTEDVRYIKIRTKEGTANCGSESSVGTMRVWSSGLQGTKGSKMFEDVPRCSKMFEDARRWSKASRWSRLRFFLKQHCINVSLHIIRFFSRLPSLTCHLWPYLNLYVQTPKPKKLFDLLLECHDFLENIAPFSGRLDHPKAIMLNQTAFTEPNQGFDKECAVRGLHLQVSRNLTIHHETKTSNFYSYISFVYRKMKICI